MTVPNSRAGSWRFQFAFTTGKNANPELRRTPVLKFGCRSQKTEELSLPQLHLRLPRRRIQTPGDRRGGLRQSAKCDRTLVEGRVMLFRRASGGTGSTSVANTPDAPIAFCGVDRNLCRYRLRVCGTHARVRNPNSLEGQERRCRTSVLTHSR